ncbi:MAG: DUF1501 domain-containing protein [Planctomycetota bacterium]|nr:DUF1501 domain-containing protein [Planctomycetota bacterium]
MLSVLGQSARACDGINRREALRVGGLSLFAGMTLPQLLAAAPPSGNGRAKSVILVNLFGGPPHMDMFDLKPDAPEETRGEMKPTSTSVPGLQICDLMPKIAGIMDRATLIRSYSHKYNSHNPYNVLTGYDGGSDRDNYFAKVTDHPSIGSVCQYLGMGARDVAPYVMMPAFPGYTQALRRAGPYGGYLGSSFDPLFTQFEPTLAEEVEGDYNPTIASGVPTPPSIAELPDLTIDRLNRRKSLLQQIDAELKSVEKRGTVRRLGNFREKAFELLTSTKTRSAFDLDQEPQQLRDRYGSHVWGTSALIARRLVEAGTMLVTIHWEAKGNNHWDLHGNNFGMLRSHLPQLDQFVEALVLDLEERGLLESTLVVVMGEMGRTPKINAKAGRDHWPQCGFSLLFGGGTRRGCVIGATDKTAAYPTDRPVSAGDMAATIYHLLGVDASLTVPDLGNRPVHISHGGLPVKEALA